ncbi:MAG: hypothetical protein NTZ35_01995 [Ignavibacteriales bacterium]|nr:hypothetical protein [Ignavibacteriales bacterium]
MKRTLLLLLTLSLSSPILAQTRVFGEKNGYDWKKIEDDARGVYSQVDWTNKQEWIQTTQHAYKIYFLLGVFEVAAVLPSDYYYAWTDEHGKKQYAEAGHPFPQTSGVTVGQMLNGLDKFYEDFRNMSVKIVDAMNIVRFESTGKDPDEIQWWTRYFRADEGTRSQMMLEKNKKGTKK